MRFVAGTSVAVKRLVAEKNGDIAEQLATSEHEQFAPRLLVSDVANASWREARTGEVERRTAVIILANVPDMPVHWYADETVGADAVRRALAINRSVHD